GLRFFRFWRTDSQWFETCARIGKAQAWKNSLKMESREIVLRLNQPRIKRCKNSLKTESRKIMRRLNRPRKQSKRWTVRMTATSHFAIRGRISSGSGIAAIV